MTTSHSYIASSRARARSGRSRAARCESRAPRSRSRPRSRASVRSCDACSRARVTTIVRPKSGRRSNQRISSRRRTTSPTIAIDGAITFSRAAVSASVASVAVTVRWRGYVPHSMIAAGVFGERPPAMSAVAIFAQPAHAHVEHERAAGARERGPVGLIAILAGIFVPGNERHRGRNAAMRDGNSRVRRRRNACGDAGDDLEREPRRLRARSPLRRRVRIPSGRRP